MELCVAAQQVILVAECEWVLLHNVTLVVSQSALLQ